MLSSKVVKMASIRFICGDWDCYISTKEYLANAQNLCVDFSGNF